MSLLSPSLEAFWAVVQKNTVQDASKILGLTQTGVTQRIRSLERQLGVTLFIRSRKGMKLTTDGEHLLRYVKVSIENEGMTLAQLKNTAKDHIIRLNISGPSSIMRSRVIPNLININEKYPFIRFAFQFSDTETILEQIKTGQCDIGLLNPKFVANEFDSKMLQPQKYVLVGPVSWKRKMLSDALLEYQIIDFEPNDYMTYEFLEKFKLISVTELKTKIANRHFANNTDAIAQLVSQGWGYSVLTEEFWVQNREKYKLMNLIPEKTLNYPLALAWYPRYQMPEYLKEIIRKIK